MTTHPFNFSSVDPSWYDCLQQGLVQLDLDYLQQLTLSEDWLPGKDKIFNAFSLPLDRVNYVLFGESPYPRQQSANGYAFWDAAVQEIWSPTGFNKNVNRATSLRNILKMLLIAEGLMDPQHTAQEDIARINKTSLIQTNKEFFTHLLNHGFLLLNATLVLQSGPPKRDAQAWHPFTHCILDCLIKKRPTVKLVLLGRIAGALNQFIQHHPQANKLYAEHPYNISFITNHKVIDFFKPFHLLCKT